MKLKLLKDDICTDEINLDSWVPIQFTRTKDIDDKKVIVCKIPDINNKFSEILYKIGNYLKHGAFNRLQVYGDRLISDFIFDSNSYQILLGSVGSYIELFKEEDING